MVFKLKLIHTMANIEKIIEKLESLGFVEVVLSTTEVFWQKKDVKVKLDNSRLIASIYDQNQMGDQSQEFDANSENILEIIERVAQW